MAYKNKMAYSDKMYHGNEPGNMDATVKDYQKPAKCYSQKYTQAPLNYIERQDYQQGHEAMKLNKEDYKGRYQK